MKINKIKIGKNPPYEINVIIEIPKGTIGVKYEVDKESGAIFVDRFMPTTMSYPLNYGFIPHTLANDGDPTDVLILNEYPVVPGAVIACRPVGVLLMEDESGFDEKILAVPLDKLDQSSGKIKDIDDVNAYEINRITHFFENYKKLEKNKWVKITGWENVQKAYELIAAATDRAKQI